MGRFAVSAQNQTGFTGDASRAHALAHRARLPGFEEDPGLDHYQGRGWRGFHHATLSNTAYGFLMEQRLKAVSDTGSKKTLPNATPTDSVLSK